MQDVAKPMLVDSSRKPYTTACLVCLQVLSMISAMPAVAVRRERKRSQSRASSRANSLASVHGQGNNKLTHSISTISSTGGPPVTCSTVIPIHCRRALAASELRYARLRFLMKTGTVLMASGLVLVFLGVGMKLPHVQHIAFLFIAVGVVCCVVKITLAEAEHVPAPSAPSTVYTAPSTPGDENECTSLLGTARRIPKSSSQESNMSVASTSSRLLSPAQDLPPPPLPQPPGSKPRRLPRSPSQESSFGTSHFASYKRSPRSPPAESNQFFTNSSYLGHIVTPTGLNSIPETQVLITVDRERY
ncbi:hypothetical protein LAZ67_14000313 [Cordylochernes scorpioides]|uniref:Transmembrane protein n=1 Tax=Cordylochernes scorpioides TaxID=51811 RepID=A0ABY6L927_9ARAC|nr:hypothetical protein LAZ67_14000311 [Cordylochernes scorpioides]UYV76409.1 hypothetical protein LAZ67_14000313 [Cordylochernes scorpioides]